MFKKITREQARVGMYVQQLCGSWYDHPFWQRSFLIRDSDMLARLQASAVEELWIDPAKGIAGGGDGLARAAELVNRARAAVCALFSQVRAGDAAALPATLASTMPLVDDIIGSISHHPGAMLSLIRLRTSDDYTYTHSVAVCALMVALAQHMDMAPGAVRECGLAGLLHDIGKATVPPEILNKPDRLSPAEFEAVKLHPVTGHALLNAAGGLPAVVVDVCLHHHERYDGTGYPSRLAGEDISLQARMGAVCDVYDAITSQRPYKAPWSPPDALRRMAAWSREGHFDPAVFAAFVRCIGIAPAASFTCAAEADLL
jgi:HD-GYP domain-containing protein (c-di-GMP phosphodiesterase class II)